MLLRPTRVSWVLTLGASLSKKPSTLSSKVKWFLLRNSSLDVEEATQDA